MPILRKLLQVFLLLPAALMAVPASLPIETFPHSDNRPLVHFVGNDLLFSAVGTGQVYRRHLSANGLGAMERPTVPADLTNLTPSRFGVYAGGPSSGNSVSLFSAPQYELAHSVSWPGMFATSIYDATPDWIVKASSYQEYTRSNWPSHITQAGTYLEATCKDPTHSFTVRIGGSLFPNTNSFGQILIQGDRALLMTSSNPRKLYVLNLLTQTVEWSSASFPSTFVGVGLVGNVAILTNVQISGTSSEVMLLNRNQPEASFLLGVPDAPSPWAQADSYPAILRIVPTSTGFWMASFGSPTRDSLGIRHYQFDESDTPKVDFLGKLPSPPGTPYKLEWASFGADENRAVFVSTAKGIEIFDRANDLPVLTIGDIELSEAEEHLQVTATLDRAVSWPVTFTLRPKSASAVVGEDVSNYERTIVIPPGSTTSTWTETILADSIKEHDEMFLVQVSGLNGATQARDSYNVTIRGIGLTSTTFLTVKGGPAGLAATQLLSYSENGYLLSEPSSGRIASCASDGTYLGMLEGSTYQLTHVKQLDDRSWSAFRIDTFSNQVTYLNWLPGGGPPRYQINLSTLGASLKGGNLVLKDGRVIFGGPDSNLKALDPATGATNSLPPIPGGLVPDSLVLLETPSKIVAYAQYRKPDPIQSGYFSLCSSISTFSKADLSLLFNIPPGEPATPDNMNSSEVYASGDVLFLPKGVGAVDLTSGEVLWNLDDSKLFSYPFQFRPGLGKVVGLAENMLIMGGIDYQAGLALIDLRTGYLLRRIPMTSSIPDLSEYQLGNGFFTVSLSSSPPEVLRFSGIIPSIPELQVSLSNALPGHGAVLTAAWDFPYTHGTTFSWKLNLPIGSKLAAEFPVSAGQFQIPPDGQAQVLIPMRSPATLENVGSILSLETSTPQAGAPGTKKIVSSRILNGYESIVADQEIPNPKGTLPQYGKLATGGGFVACRTSRYYPETGLFQGEVDLFDGETAHYLRTFVPAESQDRVSFGTSIRIQGNFILIGSPYPSVTSSRPETTGSVTLFRIDTGELIRRFSNPLRVTSFGETLASDSTFFAIGAPGIMPSTARGARAQKAGFAVYRWSDLKQLGTKTSNNEYLARSLEFQDGQLLVGAPTATVTNGRSRIAGAGVVYSYLPATKRMNIRWSPRSPITNGMFGSDLSISENAVWISGKHRMPPNYSLQNGLWGYALDGQSSSPVALAEPDRYSPFFCNPVTPKTSILRGLGLAFQDLRSNQYLGSIKLTQQLDVTHTDHVVVGSQIYWVSNGSLFRKTLKDIYTYGIWSRLHLGDAATGDPVADLNHNGRVDFDDYLDALLESGPPVEFLSGGGGQPLKFRERRSLPPGIIAQLEVELSPGLWQPIASCEGAESWRSSGTSWTDGSSPDLNVAVEQTNPNVRVVIQAHPSLLVKSSVAN